MITGRMAVFLLCLLTDRFAYIFCRIMGFNE